MSTNFLRFSVMGVAAVSGYANAIGFGDITLHSAIGQSLRAEVPLIGVSGEAVDNACFALAPLEGSDLPVVTAARVRVVRGNAGYRLMILGQRPIAEPIFTISLRASCGVDLQRDYVLMPEPPLSQGDGEPPAAPVAVAPPPPPPPPATARTWRASSGDTLESIAESLAGGSAAQQQRMLSALRRANPQLHPDDPLSEGSAIRVPDLKRRTPAESPAIETMARVERPPARIKSPAAPGRREIPPPASDAPLPAPAPRDRLLVGAAPAETSAPAKAAAQPSMGDIEARMLKLETTLHSLNSEVDKLNNALMLATEVLAAQNKLQTLQSPLPAAAPAQATPPAAPPGAPRSNWLDLLFSALLGGGIAAGLAGVLSRRRERRSDLDLPLAVTAYRPEIPAAPAQDEPSATVPLADPPPASPAGVDIPLDGFSAPPPSAAPVGPAVLVDDNESALELAEIMLSFGRIRGAADTLAQHIEENAPANIQPWTMLLDLYRRGDMRQEFENLMLRVRERFNVQVAGWDDLISPISGLKSIENYAHIIERVVKHWGQQACLDYLYDLVHDNRAGQRDGFPLEVVEEIVLLMRVQEAGYGLKRPA